MYIGRLTTQEWEGFQDEYRKRVDASILRAVNACLVP